MAQYSNTSRSQIIVDPNDHTPAEQPANNSGTPPNELTPSSSAPTQTSPVSSAKSSGIKKLIIAIIAAIIVVGGLVFLFLSPWSPFISAAPLGPKLTIGNNNYIYACGVTDKALVAKQMGVTSDVNKENVVQTMAFDPANSKDKQEDLAKVADTESVDSTCTLKLDRVQQGQGESQKTSFVNVIVSVEQFIDESKANNFFKYDRETSSSPATLPSFGEKSFYAKPAAGRGQGAPLTLKPELAYKNMLISISAPNDASDSDGSKNAAKLDTVFKDIVTRIDHNEGQRPQNFNGVNTIGKNKFTDSCTAVNYAKVTAAMGDNTELNAKLVSSNQGMAPENGGGKTPDQLLSSCSFGFRTQSEAAAANGVKDDQLGGKSITYNDKFPHYLSVYVAQTASKADAQSFLKTARDQSQANAKKQQSDNQKTSVEDVAIGDGALKVQLDRKGAQAGSESTPSTRGQLYYITKGPAVYIFSVTYVQQDKPYKSQIHDLSLDQVKKVYKELTLASRRAN